MRKNYSQSEEDAHSITDTENILKFSEEDLLQPDAIKSVELQQLAEILELATARSVKQGIIVNETTNTRG